ncbi:MAG: S4 domain-containing protein YaaA [Bacilli bacterium]|jgi:ribosome-associated protein YbcJ (S4-like RNA binding protein)|nr:S4 domain-containing protein YaaA [Bacilli bacterium]MCH4202259.1 S4 domain-containing protein YaaA [Bacilli bacterium]MCH4236009.1 S4 domain-containing protein YaaA [Bacilli bacterium]
MADNTQNVLVKGEYITLGQLLKKVNLIATGGEAKTYLQGHSVFVDGVIDARRGRKLFPGMSVRVDSSSYVITADDR